MTALPSGLQPYTPADLTPLPGLVAPAARVALAYGRLHAGEGARWAEVLFGVGDGGCPIADAAVTDSRGER